MPLMSVSGVVSGMDWESMIDKIIEKAQAPAMVQVSKRTNLQNKKSLFEEMKVTMNSIQSSLTPLKLPSTYKAKELTIERTDNSNSSYKKVLTASVNADAEVNVYELSVTQIAKAQTNRSKQITDSTLASTLSTAGITNGKLYVNMGGRKIGIDVNSSDSLQTLKSRINNTLKTLEPPLGVTASIVDNRLIIQSDSTGEGKTSASETITYNAGGVNRLSNMSVNEEDLKNGNFAIREYDEDGNVKKTYVYGKDYYVVNGNEIRWKQYSDTNELKLGEKLQAQYTMAEDDVYKIRAKKGEDASLPFDPKDNGTLSSRLKITAANDDGTETTYYYGKDFTLDSAGKVSWIEAPVVDDTPKYNEPDSYTVNYSKDVEKSYSISGNKVSTAKAPDSYTVSYTKTETTRIHSNGRSGIAAFDSSSHNFAQLASLVQSYQYDDAPSVTFAGDQVRRDDTTKQVYFRDDYGFTLTDNNGSTYEYGKDYVLIDDRNAPPASRICIAWNKIGSGGLPWVQDWAAKTGNTYETPTSSSIPASYDLTFTPTHTETSSDPAQVNKLIQLANNHGDLNSSSFTVTDDKGNTYTYAANRTADTLSSRQFSVDSSGNIVWPYSDAGSDLDAAGFEALQAQYSEATGSELPTVTLIDGEGIIRTYVDPSDPSVFTMEAGGQEYIYGRDYVIRVSDDGEGYVVSWAITGDTNEDGILDIKDVNPAVSAYTAYKDISTSSWKQAPSSGNYIFSANYMKNVSLSGDVNASDTDKSLSAILGESVPASDYSNVSISGYTQGKDYVINSTGTIRWLNQNSKTPEAYKATYKFSDIEPKTFEGNLIGGDSGYASLSGISSKGMGVKTFQAFSSATNTTYTYIDEAEGKAAFTLTDSKGNTYEYGKDFALRATSAGSNSFTLIWSNNRTWPSGFTKGTASLPDSSFKLTYNNTATRFVDATESLSAGLGFTPSDWSKLTLTDASGNEYTEGTDYAIDTSASNPIWLGNSPGKPSAYTVTMPYSFDMRGGSTDMNLTTEYGFPNYADLKTAYASLHNGAALPTVSGVPGSGYTFIDDPSVLSIDGYTYGKDYVLRLSVNNSDVAISWAGNDSSIYGPVGAYANYKGISTSGFKSPTSSVHSVFKGSSKATVTLNADNEDTALSTLLGTSIPANSYKDLVVSNGATTYINGRDYEFEDGKIKWLIDDEVENPEHPEEGTEYTLIYEAFDEITSEGTYKDESQQEIAITVDDRAGNISGNKLSYEQIIKNADISINPNPGQTKIDNSLSKYFTLTDSDGYEYKYGTDYRIIKGTTTDSTSGESSTAIEWISTGTQPSNNVTFTLGYGGKGGEVYTLGDAVTRSYTDDIRSALDIDSMKYSRFDGASVRIYDQYEEYEQGVDFYVEDDGTGAGDEPGNARIVWIQGTPEPASWVNFNGAKSVTFTAGGKTYTMGSDKDFLISKNDDGSAKITLNEDVDIPATGSYTVNVTTASGASRVYTLTSDGTDLSLTQNSQKWFNQDTSQTSDYTIAVTKDNVLTEINATRIRGSRDIFINPTGTPSAEDLNDGTVTITQNGRTYYKDVDFTITTNESTGRAEISWNTGTNYEWYFPNPGSNSRYTINFTDKDGNESIYYGVRNSVDTLDLGNFGFTTANGSIKIGYELKEDGFDPVTVWVDPEELAEYEDVTETDDDGNITTRSVKTKSSGNEMLSEAKSLRVYRGTNGSNTVFNFNWLAPSRTTNPAMPAYGTQLRIDYEYKANSFTLTDDSNDGESGIIKALELNSNVTQAQNAKFILDGEELERESNDIGESYDNELIKGMTLHLKGTGDVSLDVAHDAQKAVESIQTFVDSYNDLMSWMNTRMTEKEVDKDIKATIDSDDFRMRWGLLHGNALLRNTKSQMRTLVTQNFSYSFTQRSSSEEIYGNMAFNGLRSSSTLRLRIKNTYVDVPIELSDTIDTIAAKINDSENPSMRNIFYGDDGKLLEVPLLKARVENDRLIISSSNDDSITMSGSAAMNALKMNYTYKGLYQIGLATTANDYGKSGELEFDTNKFMEALEDNPDEVQELMLMFVNQTDSWAKSMLMSSSSGEVKGTLTRQIEDLESQISSIDEYLEKYQDRLDRQEESLRTRFAAAEQSISKLSQQANSIAAILNQLNGYAANSNSSS